MPGRSIRSEKDGPGWREGGTALAGGAETRDALSSIKSRTNELTERPRDGIGFSEIWRDAPTLGGPIVMPAASACGTVVGRGGGTANPPSVARSAAPLGCAANGDSFKNEPTKLEAWRVREPP